MADCGSTVEIDAGQPMEIDAGQGLQPMEYYESTRTMQSAGDRRYRLGAGAQSAADSGSSKTRLRYSTQNLVCLYQGI